MNVNTNKSYCKLQVILRILHYHFITNISLSENTSAFQHRNHQIEITIKTKTDSIIRSCFIFSITRYMHVQTNSYFLSMLTYTLYPINFTYGNQFSWIIPVHNAGFLMAISRVVVPMMLWHCLFSNNCCNTIQLDKILSIYL